MPSWFGIPVPSSVQAPLPPPHRTGMRVLTTLVLVLLTGCAAPKRWVPPLASLSSGYKYRPLTPETREHRGTTRTVLHNLEGPGPAPVSRPLPPSPGLGAPGGTSAPPRAAPAPRPMPPIRAPTSANPPLEMPTVKAPQPVALPMPFWAQVALFVLLPGTAHAPDHVPDCERTRPQKNEHLAGQKHPVTGVPYNGGGYPIFEPIAEVTIPEELRSPEVSDARQFADASRQLRETLEHKPVMATLFSPEQLEAIRQGWPRIPGLTWHHHEDGMTLQLVDRDTHARTGHSGGRETSGGRPK